MAIVFTPMSADKSAKRAIVQKKLNANNWTISPHINGIPKPIVPITKQANPTFAKWKKPII